MSLNNILFALAVGSIQILGLVLILRRLRGRPWLRRGLAGLFLAANLPWLFFHRVVEDPTLLSGWVTPVVVRPSLTWQFGAFLIMLMVGLFSLVRLAVGRLPRWVIRRLRRSVAGAATAGERLEGEQARDTARGAGESISSSAVGRRSVIKRVLGAGALGGIAAAAGWGLARAGRPPRVVKHDLALPGLPPALAGLTIAHLTDLHAGPWIGTEELARALEITRDLRPDLVLFTGDLVDVSPRFCVLLTRHLPLLKGVPLGVYGVTGNHDVYTGVDAVASAMESAGMVMLRDRNTSLARLGAPLSLVGVDDTGRSWMSSGGAPSLERAMEGLPRDEVPLLLAHRPTAFINARRAGIPLTLCGHTHGGQFGVPGGPNLADVAYQHTHGVYRQGGHLLHVSAGIGAVGLPFRLGVPAEIGLLRLVAGPGEHRS